MYWPKKIIERKCLKKMHLENSPHSPNNFSNGRPLNCKEIFDKR